MDKKIAHLYSGGTDSTYAAVIASQLFDMVHLLTFYRKGLSCVRNSEYYVSKLRAVLGASKFQHHFFNIDKDNTSYIVSEIYPIKTELIQAIDYTKNIYDFDDTVIPYQELRYK